MKPATVRHTLLACLGLAVLVGLGVVARRPPARPDQSATPRALPQPIRTGIAQPAPVVADFVYPNVDWSLQRPEQQLHALASFRAWVASSPTDAVRWLDTLTDDLGWAALAYVACLEVAVHDPAGALQLALQFGIPPESPLVLSILCRWQAADATPAQTWVDRNLTGAARDAAYSAFARSAPSITLAMQQADQVAAPASRAKLRYELACRLAHEDPGSLALAGLVRTLRSSEMEMVVRLAGERLAFLNELKSTP